MDVMLVILRSFLTYQTFLLMTYAEYVRDVIVQTSSGAVRGRQRQEHLNIGPDAVTGTADEFLGIPYAEPPIGNLRFRAPVRHGPWDDIRNCTYPGWVCPQVVYYTQTAIGLQNEDCLFLNVWRPLAEVPDGGFPVMLFIHGGSYEEGSGDRYNGYVLSLHGVVVVTINYRLGVLGYLSTGDSDLPGNYGLRDQIMALEWVKDNIEAFHGNPNDVTLFGSSAGSSSVGLLLLVSSAKNLFHRAVMQSGVPTSFWSVYNETINLRQFTSSIATRLNCRQKEMSDRVNCLREIDYQRFIDLHWKFPRIVPSDLNFKPVVDGELLRAQPIDLFMRGDYTKVPIMTGVVQEEWARSMGWFYKDLENTGIDKEYSDGFDRLSFEQSISHVSQDRFWWPPEVADVITHFYTDWRNAKDPDANRDNYIHFMSDLAMVAPTVKLSQILSVGGDPGTTGNPKPPPPVFLYKINHRSIHTDPEWWGCYHSLELDYIFGSPYVGYDIATDQPQNHTSEDRRFSSVLMRLWTNFAKSGSPMSESDHSPHWAPYTMADQHYLLITTGHLTLKSHLRAEKVAFWNNLIPNLVEKIASRQPYVDVNFSYRIYMWLVLIVAAILTLIIAILSFILLSVSRSREELQVSISKNNIPAVANCNSNSHVKPQML